MIHNFDFTGDIPKVIIYNGGTKPCSLSDCILIMFLKLVGFDILVYAPTGYRVIEQYIGNKWFNEITIGLYDFNLEDITFNSFSSIQRNSNQNKKGFFKKLFG